jgi:hypothetical protein
MLPTSVGSYTIVILMVLPVVLGVLTVSLKLAECLFAVRLGVELIVATLGLSKLVGLQVVAEEETSSVLVAMLDLVIERVLVHDEDAVVELGSVSGLLRRSNTERSSMVDGGKTGSASLSDSGRNRECDLGRREDLRRDLGGRRTDSVLLVGQCGTLGRTIGSDITFSSTRSLRRIFF